MSEAEIDWNRIQKALNIELERGCMNIQGNQYLFHEFLVISLANPPAILPTDILQKWRAIAQKFSMYPNLDHPTRQELIKNTQYLCALTHNYLLTLENLMSLDNSLCFTVKS